MDAKKILTQLMDISERNYFETHDGTGYQGAIYDVTDDVVRMWYGGISAEFNGGDVKSVDEFVVPLKDINLTTLAYYDEEEKKQVTLSRNTLLPRE